MMTDVRERLERVPFKPFVIKTSDRHEYPVPTGDHAHISPRVNQVVIFLDEGPAVLLWPIHINSIINQQTDGAS